jgi:hypothetical protein
LKYTQQQDLMFQPIAETIKSCTTDFEDLDLSNLPSCKVLNKAFNHTNLNQKSLTFVTQDESLAYPGLAYEERIFLHGLIATRNENWHDFFNAMVWKKFSQCKIAINYVHHQEILSQHGTIRSRKRDLLTLFDECGVIVIANDHILQLIKDHQWHELFISNRDQWLEQKIKIITFGHAMFEKYQNPYIGMTAQALLLNTEMFPTNNTSNLDAFLATGLMDLTLLIDKSELSPLPLLGIPLWHQKQDALFYSNTNYFRC